MCKTCSKIWCEYNIPWSNAFDKHFIYRFIIKQPWFVLRPLVHSSSQHLVFQKCGPTLNYFCIWDSLKGSSCNLGIVNRTLFQSKAWVGLLHTTPKPVEFCWKYRPKNYLIYNLNLSATRTSILLSELIWYRIAAALSWASKHNLNLAVFYKL